MTENEKDIVAASNNTKDVFQEPNEHLEGGHVAYETAIPSKPRVAPGPRPSRSHLYKIRKPGDLS